MQKRRPLLTGTMAVAMVGTLTLAGSAGDGTTPPGEVLVIRDLVYAVERTEGGAERNLDVYVGTGGAGAPLVVHAPGQGQHRTAGTTLATALAEQGATVFAIDTPDLWQERAFRGNAEGLRELAENVACAVRFARGSAYGGETATLVLSGFSYGAGIVSHVALAGEDFDRWWDAFGESGGPPSQLECTFDEASSDVDALVGIAGTYDIFLGYESYFDDEFWLEHRDIQAMLQGTLGLHPELRVRLLVGGSDWLPYEVPATFASLAAETGHDVELIEFEGGHVAPIDLAVETVMDLGDA